MRALVTGGGGFLGGAIVRRLRARGDAVRSFSRRAHPWLNEIDAESIQGDLGDADAVHRAVEGVDIVYHVAALAGVWGPASSYERANVDGTRHVLDACRAHGVGRLVLTSSPSVVFDGTDQDGVNESAPYPSKYLAHYPRTKAIAERMVLEANGPDLATVALRPHLIWGPGDPHLVPRIIERARAGRLRLVRHGDGRERRVDSVYVDNAADAHVLAADRLAPGAAPAGHAYFITNGQPTTMAELINRVLDAAGLPPVTRSVPAGLAWTAGVVLEGIGHLLRRRNEPIMTRFVARQLATAHWFDISAARRDLGYEPAVSMDDGMRRLAESLGR